MFFFFSSRRRHTRWPRDWSSDVCSSDLEIELDRRGTSKDGNQDADLAFLVVDFFDRTRKVFERTVDNHDVVALFELGERFWLGFIDAHFGFDIFDRSEDTRLNSSHVAISYAVFCLKKKTSTTT